MLAVKIAKSNQSFANRKFRDNIDLERSTVCSYSTVVA
jgi:hypothetical protein